MLDCHSGTLHWCRCVGSQPLTVQQAGLIMTLRSEIITRIPTNTAILHLDEQLLSGSLSLSRGVFMQPNATNRILLLPATDISKGGVLGFMHFFFTISPKTTLLSFSLSFFLLSPKDTTVSGVKTWLWFGFSKAMSHAGLFSPQWTSGWSICPHMCSVGPALPTLLIAGDVLDSVQLTSKETRYIIVRRGTSGDQTEADFVRPLNLSTKCFGHKRLSCLAWSQSMRFSHFNCETGNTGHASQTNTHASAAVS